MIDQRLCISNAFEWNAGLTFVKYIQFIYQLFINPVEPTCFNNEKIRKLYIQDKKQHDKMAKQWTDKFAN